MNTEQLIDALSQRVLQVKELKEAVETLQNNNVNIELFLYNNPEVASKLKSNQVADYVLKLSMELVDKKVHLNIIKNVYDEYTLIFIMLALCESTKSVQNKLYNIIIDVLSNSSKFDLYIRKRVNLTKISSDAQIMEFFWLIPLFTNTKALLATNYSGFISGNKNVARVVSEYTGGYEYYVTNSNIKNIDVLAYKQYLTEGLQLAAKQSA